MMWTPKQRISTLASGDLIALLSVVLAIGITFAILQTAGFRAQIGYAYLFAILVSGWRGYGAGLLACALSFFAAPYVFIPKFSPTKVDLNRLVLTLLVSLL